jgi:hypothetical protein
VPQVWDAYLRPNLPTGFPGLGANTPCEGLANGVIPMWDTNNTLGTPHLGGVDKTTAAIKFRTFWATTGTASNTPQYASSPFWFWPPPPFFLSGQGCGNSGGPMAYIPGDSYFFTNFRGEQWGGGQTNMWTHWHESGLALGQFGAVEPIYAAFSINAAYGRARGTTSAAFKGLPGAAGNAAGYGVGRVNNVYYLYNSDEWYHGGFHRFSVSNLQSIQVSDVPVSWNSSAYVAPTPDPYDLLSGLPYDTAGIANGAGGWTRNPLTDQGGGYNDGYHSHVAFGTSVQNYQIPPRQSPDLFVSASLPSGTASLVKALPRSKSGDWSISGTVSFGEWWSYSENYTAGPPSYIVMDVLDGTGKIILRMYNGSDAANHNFSYFFNGHPVTTSYVGLSSSWANWRRDYSGALNDFVVTTNIAAGTMNAVYAGLSVAPFAPYQAGADITRPSQFRILYQSALFLCVNITKLRFAES